MAEKELMLIVCIQEVCIHDIFVCKRNGNKSEFGSKVWHYHVKHGKQVQARQASPSTASMSKQSKSKHGKYILSYFQENVCSFQTIHAL